MKKILALFLAVLTVVLMSVPAFAVEGEWKHPNPPMNPDGSFPDGQTAKDMPGWDPDKMIEVMHNTTIEGEQGNPQKGTVVVLVNSVPVDFPDQQPYIDANNRTMVPVRFVAEALGATVNASPEGIVSIKRGNTHIALKIGESKATVNGAVKTFDTKSVLTKKFRTMVPLRFISETLGAKVGWDQQTYTVTIDL